jgi:hypothetical protein
MLGAMQPTTLQTRTADQALLALPGGQETIVDPADGRVLAGVAAAAVATDLAVRSGVAGLTGALLVAVAAAALLASGRLHTRSARLATAAAPVFGVWLAIRASPWLVPLDVLAAGGLLALGASLARGGSLADLTIPRVALRAIHAGVHAVAAPAFVAAPVRAVREQLGDDRRAELGVRIARGLLLAAPIVVLLGVLLASADAVFASFFRVDFDPVTPVEHVAALAAGAWGAAALLRVASVTPPGRLPALRPPIGAVEACIVRAATGLASPGQRAVFTVVAEVAVALTLVVVVVAVRRLNLYEDAFGLTMLRLYSELFSYWIGAVFLFLGAALAGVGHGRGWFVGAAVAAGLTLLLALNVVNPEAVVAGDQLAGTRQVRRTDVGYVARLSEDAIPTVAARLPGLDPVARADLRARLCAAEPDGVPPSRFTGWAAWNLGRERAARAITRACG